MVKTTVYLDPDVALRIRHMAQLQKRPQAELIREAVATYAQQYKRPMSKNWGKFRSGRTDVSERHEEIIMEAVREGRWP